MSLSSIKDLDTWTDFIIMLAQACIMKASSAGMGFHGQTQQWKVLMISLWPGWVSIDTLIPFYWPVAVNFVILWRFFLEILSSTSFNYSSIVQKIGVTTVGKILFLFLTKFWFFNFKEIFFRLSKNGGL